MNQLPEDFIQLMHEHWPNHADSIQNGILNAPSPTSIRLNPKKINLKPNLEKIPWTSNGYYLAERPSFIHDPAWHAGAYYVQEASSMLLEVALKQIELPNEPKALDLCGAPGGKTTHIAEVLPDDSLIISNEVIQSRATILKQNVIQWGNPNVWVTNNDPKDFNSIKSFFDVIVVDAPCSGEGMFRKDPDSQNEWSKDNVQLCASRQKRIVSEIWDSLKPEGYLIYSTCTFNRFENEENLKWLSEQNEIEWVGLIIDPSWNVTEYSEGNIKGYHCFPGNVKGEGFFIAVGQKKEAAGEIITKPFLSKKARKTIPLTSSEWSTLILNPEEFCIQSINENTQRILQDKWYPDQQFLAKNLKLIYSGLILGEQKKKNFIPSHNLSLSTVLNKSNLSIIQLSMDDTLNFLRKEPFMVQSDRKGIHLVEYEFMSVGWIKHLGNRINSLLPASKRVIKQPDMHNLWSLVSEMP